MSEPSWLHGHPHDPNPEPPSGDASFTLTFPDGAPHTVAVDALQRLPYTEAADCYIVSTGHGTSGPFCFGGVLLEDLLAAYTSGDAAWRYCDIVSGDGFGNRILRAEVEAGEMALLAYALDGRGLTREEGLVRLIVPGETDDALRQVKWIAHIRLNG
ncbi:MAG: molybdopterin-dependent oxidoreductase [Caldilineaceae bacterium]|nr:molybdopterin-dependent oxidoreductase [Caldilineaceae bacterium]